MQIQPNVPAPRGDEAIASAAATLLDASPIFPKDTVKATVQDGWITLEGKLHWWFQKTAAAHTVHDLPGVTGITNLITVRTDDGLLDIVRVIQPAYKCKALLEAYHLRADTPGNQEISGMPPPLRRARDPLIAHAPSRGRLSRCFSDPANPAGEMCFLFPARPAHRKTDASSITPLGDVRGILHKAAVHDPTWAWKPVGRLTAVGCRYLSRL